MRPCRPPGRAPRGGFTLVELLAVLVIISLIGGLSAGALQLARRQYALSASASHIEGAIRAARNAAISSGIPARVVIDGANAKVTAYGFESVGEWGFEEEEDGVTYGARRAPATLGGGASLVAGHAGNGLALSGASFADCGASPVYDLRAGVHAEAWIRWEGGEAGESGSPGGSAAGPARAGTRARARTSQVVLSGPVLTDAAGILGKGRAYFLGLAPDGAVEGRIGDYRARTAPGAVLPGRWTKVALTFDGETLRLVAGGVDRELFLPDDPLGRGPTGKPGGKGINAKGAAAKGHASDPGAPAPPKEIPGSAEPLVIGSSTRSFAGVIDEVRLYGMAQPLIYELGPQERFLGWKKVVRFDRRGRLDPRFHEEAVQVHLAGGPEPAEPVLKTEAAIDYTVTFQEWATRRGLAPDAMDQAAAEEKLLMKFSGNRLITIRVDLAGALR